MHWKRVVLLVCCVLIIGLYSVAVPGLAQDTSELSLAEEGPYAVGVQIQTLVDSNRQDLELEIGIWYPALAPQDGSRRNRLGWVNADPDTSSAPYPLILFSHWWSGRYTTNLDLFQHLASYGFVVVSPDHLCDYEPTCPIDRPLDMFFVLDYLADDTESSLAGIIDTDNAGVMGISFGGYTTLVTAGGQLHPANFLDWVTNVSAERIPFNFWDQHIMDTYWRRWDEVEAYAAQVGIAETSELWSFPTNDRIRAALPIMPALSTMIGETGLETITIPTMIFAGTEDEIVPYVPEITSIYTSIGAEARYLISFVGYGHSDGRNPRIGGFWRHFSTAFFGYYLQGNEDYAEYLTADFVNGFDDLAFGIYEGDE